VKLTGSIGFLEMKSIDCAVGEIPWNGTELDRNSPTYLDIVRVNNESRDKGIFTFDEMFLWANEAIKNPSIKEAISYRFPYLFIDEAQDNSELQSSLLSKLFSLGAEGVTRQRLGDENQAIFNYSGQDGAATDPFPFPDRAKVKELPNSHRFGKEIADLANPFIASPLTTALVGGGPNLSKGNPDTSNKHTLILFEESEILEVLPTYADIILGAYQSHSSIIGKGDFVAVGAVHNKPKGKMKPPPHHIRHYFPAYDALITKKEAKPKTFLEYIYRAQNQTNISNSTFDLVEAFNEAIIKCIQITGGDAVGLRKNRKCKHIREMLNRHSRLHNLTMLSLIKPSFEFDEKNWTARWVNAIKTIVRDIDGTVNFTNLNDFLTWVPPKPSVSKKEDGISKNVFVFNGDKGEEIKVRLGSIHSVKGQTHTATLILDTFKGAYHFKHLKKCVTQKEFTDTQRTNNSLLDRMKLHYVAATRPTHLLCIAARKDHFTEKEIAYIRDSGMWKVTVLSGE
jgi:superfamily I DNA/RNA helicase